MLLPVSQRPSSSDTTMITCSWWASSQARSRFQAAAGRRGREGRVHLQVQETGGGQQAEQQQREVVARGGERGLGDRRGAGRHQRPGLQECGKPGGTPRREPVQPGHPGRGLAGAAHPAALTHRDQDQHDPQGQFDGQDGVRRRGPRLGRLASRQQDDAGDHYDQARQPAKDEGQALPGAPVRAEDQDERGQRERLERNGEADEQKVEYHAATAAGPESAGRQASRSAVIRPAAIASRSDWWSRSF